MDYEFEDLTLGDDLPDPDVPMLRASLDSFPWATGVGIDKWRPRTGSQLSDEALGWLISLFFSVERLGSLPALVRYIILVTIPKPSGDGGRLTGLLPTFYRAWARLRSDQARSWGKGLNRKYLSCRAGVSAIDAVMDCAFHDELSKAIA